MSDLTAAEHANDRAAATLRRLPSPIVLLAFALGGFLGLYSGLLAPIGSGANYVVFAFWAVLLGFGFSRITSRWMVSRNWGRGRIQKKAK